MVSPSGELRKFQADGRELVLELYTSNIGDLSFKEILLENSDRHQIMQSHYYSDLSSSHLDSRCLPLQVLRLTLSKTHSAKKK